jgi:hypothetical protein
MKLTVACVFVTGHVPFQAEYVTRLRNMAFRTLPDHEFICFTNRERELPLEMRKIHVEPPRGVYAWWTKVQLFNAAHRLTGRVLYLDLDVLLIKDVKDVVDYPSEFALVPDGAPGFKPKLPLVCVKCFNSSVMVFNAGVHPELYEAWNPFVARRLWGDQDWIGERVPKADRMPIEWFPRLSEVPDGRWSAEAKVVLCKKPKNSEALVKYPWFKEAWQ